jgi:hypothetical protein
MFEQRFNSRPLSRSDAQDGAEIKNWGKESHPDLVGSHEEIGEKIKDCLHLKPKCEIIEVLSAAAEIPAIYFIPKVSSLLSSRVFRVGLSENPEQHLFFLEEILEHAHAALINKDLFPNRMYEILMKPFYTIFTNKELLKRC